MAVERSNRHLSRFVKLRTASNPDDPFDLVVCDGDHTIGVLVTTGRGAAALSELQSWDGVMRWFDAGLKVEIHRWTPKAASGTPVEWRLKVSRPFVSHGRWAPSPFQEDSP